jgi:ABC-2 type transport system permease protein
MAGVTGVGMKAPGGGLFGREALAQYAALARVRWRMFIHGLRSIHGIRDLGATGIAWMFYSVFGLGFGIGLCAAAYSIASSASWQYLPILPWAVSFLWLMLPIAVASFQEQSELGTLLRFPVRFGSYFLMYSVSGLMEPSTFVGALCCFGVWLGIVIARPDLSLWATLGLTVFAVFNLLLVRSVFAWIDRWLAQRKTREILGALFMVLILSMQLLNPAVWQHGHRSQGNRTGPEQQIKQFMAEPWVRTAIHVQAWLPPGLAALALRRAAEQQPAPAVEALGVLGLFVLGAGSVLGLRLHAEYRGENLGAAPARKKTATKQAKAISVRQQTAEREGLAGLFGPSLASPIFAIAEKEIRSLPRTLPLLYAIGAPLLMVLVISGAFLRGGPSHAGAPQVAFPLCIFFAQIGFSQLFSNSLGTEGAGIQLYFLSPTPMRTVLLAKNLFHAAVFAVAMLIAGFMASIRLGPPDGLMSAITVAWILFVLPVNLAVGDVLSLTMPYRVNPGRITRQRGSQASALLSLLFQGGTLGVGAAVYELCSLGGMVWLAVPAFLVLAAVAVFVWLRILGNVYEIANQNKDLLIATLMKAE